MSAVLRVGNAGWPSETCHASWEDRGVIAPRWMFRVAWALDGMLDRVSRGRLDARRPGPATLRLTTLGRRSGQRRINGVYYVTHAGGWAVVPSNAGSAREPAWWLNLQANPAASVRIAGREHPVRARTATADEERELWPRLEAMNQAYRAYRATARRAIPIVILERQAP